MDSIPCINTLIRWFSKHDVFISLVIDFKCIIANMGFNHVHRLCMFVATQKISIGSVCEVHQNAYCSGVLLGEGNVFPFVF